jgi:hypothetical protein
MELRRLRLVVALSLSMVVGCLSPRVPPTPAARLSALDLLAEPADPNVRYYVILFASQSTPRVPARCHSWGMAVKVTQVEGGGQEIETHTISWLPDSMNVRWWRFKVEPGSNYSNDFSIAIAQETGQRVSAWGPYETWHGLYRRFIVQKEFLDSDAIGYQCTDAVGESARKGNGCDCFHAMSDMDPYFDRSRYPLRYFGDQATLNIVRQLQERPTLVNPTVTHDWLFAALGLDRYPIHRRRYDGKSVEFSPEAVMKYLATQPSRTLRR